MKNKKFFYIFIIIVIITIFSLLIIFNYKNKEPLRQIGYNELEIKEINKLTESEINIILKQKYNKNLIFIITSNKYDSNKLEDYIKYTLKYNDINYLKIFEMINNSNFNKKKIDEYTKLLRKYENTDSIINYVNNYNDKNIEVNEFVLKLLEEKYFIKEFLERYINYQKENIDFKSEEIVKRVNSNLDYKFYENSNKADISKGMYTLVNKFYYLEKDFVPSNLVSATKEYTTYNAKLNKDAYDNFVNMANDAKLENLTLKITTGYRDYNFQSILYNNYVKLDGVKNADTYSARPGYSEHQLGYSADLTNANNVSFDEFENTKEYTWLQKNAHKYGFIERYPKNKEYITGYIYEAWHYRYVGTEIATYIYENDLTYEEYYAYFLR